MTWLTGDCGFAHAAFLVRHRNHFAIRHIGFLLYIDLAACGEVDGYVWRAVLPSIIVRLLIVRPILIFIVIHQVGYIKQERPQKLFDCLRIRFKLDNRCGSFDCDHIIDS